MKLFLNIFLLLALKTLSAQAVTGYCNYDFIDFRGYGCVAENIFLTKKTDNLTIDGEHFPLDDDSTVLQFTIQKSEVRYFPTSILPKYKNLKYLALNNVFLSDITETSFANCGPLSELHLEYNELTILRDGVFSQCAGLEILYLNNNKISTIRKNAFAGLLKLFSIHFEANFYTTFPVELFAPLPKLVTLLIGGSNFSVIHPRTFVYNQLAALHIYKGNLTAIPRDLFKGQLKLSTLDIIDNPIATIEPGTLQPMENLWKFMLESSLIATVDAGIFAGLKNLNSIYIGWSKLNSIHPDAFVDNVNLRFFQVPENRLEILNGTTLRNNPKVQYISFNGNYIKAIERNFFDSFGSGLREVFAGRNRCIDRNLYSFTNFTTQVQPYFRNCYNAYDALFPPKAAA